MVLSSRDILCWSQVCLPHQNGLLFNDSASSFSWMCDLCPCPFAALWTLFTIVSILVCLTENPCTGSTAWSKLLLTAHLKDVFWEAVLDCGLRAQHFSFFEMKPENLCIRMNESMFILRCWEWRWRTNAIHGTSHVEILCTETAANTAFKGSHLSLYGGLSVPSCPTEAHFTDCCGVGLQTGWSV